jgi:hypothetical protein
MAVSIDDGRDNILIGRRRNGLIEGRGGGNRLFVRAGMPQWSIVAIIAVSLISILPTLLSDALIYGHDS